VSLSSALRCLSVAALLEGTEEKKNIEKEKKIVL
jgi:hypothetical protein